MKLNNLIFFDFIIVATITLILVYLTAMVFYYIYQIKTIKYIENEIKNANNDLKDIYSRIHNRFKNILIFASSIFLYAVIFFVIQIVDTFRLTPIMLIVSLLTTLFLCVMSIILNLFFYNHIESIFNDATKSNKKILLISSGITSCSLVFILLGVFNIFL